MKLNYRKSGFLLTCAVVFTLKRNFDILLSKKVYVFGHHLQLHYTSFITFFIFTSVCSILHDCNDLCKCDLQNHLFYLPNGKYTFF